MKNYSLQAPGVSYLGLGLIQRYTSQPYNKVRQNKLRLPW